MSSTTTMRTGAELVLPFEPASAAAARHGVSRFLHDLGAPIATLVDDCVLVVSELVGNAVRHAKPLSDGSVRVACRTDFSSVDIAVTDGGSELTPVRQDPTASGVSGRGLAIVDALADSWWTDIMPAATSVHALLVAPA